MSPAAAFDNAITRRNLHEAAVWMALFAGLYASSGSPQWANALLPPLLILALALQISFLSPRKAKDEYPSHILIALLIGCLFAFYVLTTAIRSGHAPIYRAFVAWIGFCAFGVTLLPILSRPKRMFRLLIGGLMIGLFGTASGLAHRYSGTWNLAGTELASISSRSFGVFYYENAYGAYAALTLPIVFALLFRRKFSGVSLLLGLSALVLTAGLIWSGARFALIVMTVFYILVLLVGGFRKFKGIMLVVAGGGIAAVYAGSRYLGPEWRGAFDAEAIQQSILLRLSLAQTNFRIFVEQPLFGWGMGMFGFVSPAYETVVGDVINSWGHYEHAHSSYLDLLTEAGVVGAVLIVLMLGFLIVPPLLKPNGDQPGSQRRMIRTQAALALIPFGFMLLSDSLLRVPIVAMHFVLQLGLLARSRDPYIQEERPSAGRYPAATEKPLLRTPVIACILAALIATLGVETVFQLQIYRAKILNTSKLETLQILTRVDAHNPERWSAYAGELLRTATRSKDLVTRREMLGQAEQAADRALNLMPEYGPYYYLQGQILYAQRNIEQALELMERAVELSSPNIKFKADLMLMYVFEAKNTDSLLRRNRWNLRARELYESIKRLTTASKIKIRDVRMSNEPQRRYWKEYLAVAEKYSDEHPEDGRQP